MLRNPVESMGNVELARVYREHGSKVRDLLSPRSLEALKKAAKR